MYKSNWKAFKQEAQSNKKIPKTDTIKTFWLTNEHQSTSAFEQLMRGPKSKGCQSLDFDFIG